MVWKFPQLLYLEFHFLLTWKIQTSIPNPYSSVQIRLVPQHDEQKHKESQGPRPPTSHRPSYLQSNTNTQLSPPSNTSTQNTQVIHFELINKKHMKRHHNHIQDKSYKIPYRDNSIIIISVSISLGNLGNSVQKGPRAMLVPLGYRGIPSTNRIPTEDIKSCVVL